MISMAFISLQIREAAQALLLAEMRRLGMEGRRRVIEEWSRYLPSNVDPSLSLLSETAQVPAQTQTSGGTTVTADVQDLDDDDIDDAIFCKFRVSLTAFDLIKIMKVLDGQFVVS
jgi:hypothetical protein